MSVRTKSRRKITVDGEMYVWHVEKNAESDWNMLNIVSMDKSFVLSVPMGLKTPYLISKGRIFGGRKTDGIWHRYLLPVDVPEAITPAFVAAVIKLATTENGLEEASWGEIKHRNDDLWVLDLWGF